MCLTVLKLTDSNMCTYKVNIFTYNFVQALQYESHFHFVCIVLWLKQLQKDLLRSIHKIVELYADLQSFQNIINMKNTEIC